MITFKNVIATLCIFTCLVSSAHAFQTLLINEKYIYEMYEPNDSIPSTLLEEGRNMYFEAYQHPKLHEGISLEELKIDQTRFQSYEEFLADMFKTDFESYQYPQDNARYYFQVRSAQDDSIVGICAVLELNENGFYYIDQVGTHKDYRQQGIASTLLAQVFRGLPEFKAISLDTRAFNTSAQALYEKMGFQKLETHPNPKKQHTYFHYIKSE